MLIFIIISLITVALSMDRGGSARIHMDCASVSMYMCVCVRCGRVYRPRNDMAISKPLDACIDSLGKSMF